MVESKDTSTISSTEDATQTENASRELPRTVAQGASWVVCDEWRTAILNGDAPQWFELENDHRATLLKRGAGRSVWRVKLPSCTVYAKVFQPITIVDRVLRNYITKPAKREWKILRRANAMNVPCILGIAFGQKRRELDGSIVLTLAADPCESILDAWLRTRAEDLRTRRQARIELIDRAARLFALAHDKGFVHLDCHPRNILVLAERGEFGDMLFADAHPSKIYPEPSPTQYAATPIAQLDQSFHRIASRSDRFRFLRCYLTRRRHICATGDRRTETKRWARSIARERSSHAKRLANKRDRRVWRNGKYFSTFAVGNGWVATMVLKHERRHVFPERDVADRTVEQWRDILPIAIKNNEYSAKELSALQPVRFCRQPSGGLLKMLKWALLGTPHWREFLECHKHRHRDGNAPLVLGYARKRRFGFTTETVLVLPGIGVP